MGKEEWQRSETPSGVITGGTVLGSLAQSSGFQAEFHIEACYTHQSSCG